MIGVGLEQARGLGGDRRAEEREPEHGEREELHDQQDRDPARQRVRFRSIYSIAPGWSIAPSLRRATTHS